MDTFEKTLGKAANAADKVAGAASRLYRGCVILLANVFFVGFCLWGVYAAYISWQLEQNGVKTSGTVVRLEESDSSEGGCCVYSPVVEFVAKDEQTYSFESSNASDPPAYEVGEEVPVLYDPANPDTAQINKWSERWLFPLIIIPAMILTALIVNFFLIRAFWRNEDIT